MFFVFVSFSSCRPPPPGAGGVLGNFATPTVAQDYVIFLLFGGTILPRPPLLWKWHYFGFSLFRRHVFIGVFSPLRLGLLSFLF